MGKLIIKQNQTSRQTSGEHTTPRRQTNMEQADTTTLTTDKHQPLPARKEHEHACHEVARPRWATVIGKLILFMTVISFLTIGLAVNLLQALLYLALHLSSSPRWKRFIKQANASLVYVLYSPQVVALHYWTRINLDVQVADRKLIEDAKRDMLAVVLSNHTYELDWMVCIALAEQLGQMGSYKAMSKDELKYVPVIGWSFWLSDMIFLKRDWKRDRETVAKKLDQLYYYKQPILGIFAEGTRWTPEKQENSVEYAESIGIKPLKYHLIPRTRGFTYSVRHFVRDIMVNKKLEEERFKIVNMEIIIDDQPTFSDWFAGKPMNVHVYCEEVILNEQVRSEIIKSKDETDCAKLDQLLFDVFRKKDQVVEYFHQNGGRFPIDPEVGGQYPITRNWYPIIVWLLGFVFTYSIIGYLAATVLRDSLTFWSILTTYIGSSLFFINRVNYESQAKNSTLKMNYKIPEACTDSILDTSTCAQLSEEHNHKQYIFPKPSSPAY